MFDEFIAAIDDSGYNTEVTNLIKAHVLTTLKFENSGFEFNIAFNPNKIRCFLKKHNDASPFDIDKSCQKFYSLSGDLTILAYSKSNNYFIKNILEDVSFSFSDFDHDYESSLKSLVDSHIDYQKKMIKGRVPSSLFLRKNVAMNDLFRIREGVINYTKVIVDFHKDLNVFLNDYLVSKNSIDESHFGYRNTVEFASNVNINNSMFCGFNVSNVNKELYNSFYESVIYKTNNQIGERGLTKISDINWVLKGHIENRLNYFSLIDEISKLSKINHGFTSILNIDDPTTTNGDVRINEFPITSTIVNDLFTNIDSYTLEKKIDDGLINGIGSLSKHVKSYYNLPSFNNNQLLDSLRFSVLGNHDGKTSVGMSLLPIDKSNPNHVFLYKSSLWYSSLETQTHYNSKFVDGLEMVYLYVGRMANSLIDSFKNEKDKVFRRELFNQNKFLFNPDKTGATKLYDWAYYNDYKHLSDAYNVVDNMVRDLIVGIGSHYFNAYYDDVDTFFIQDDGGISIDYSELEEIVKKKLDNEFCPMTEASRLFDDLVDNELPTMARSFSENNVEILEFLPADWLNHVGGDFDTLEGVDLLREHCDDIGLTDLFDDLLDLATRDLDYFYEIIQKPSECIEYSALFESDFSPSALYKGNTLKQDGVLSRRIHERVVPKMNEMKQAMYQSNPNLPKVEWSPFFDTDLPLSHDYNLISLNSLDKLVEESTRLSHCISTYYGKASCGECYLFSIRDNNDSSVASIEVVTVPLDKDDVDAGFYYELVQLEGFKNSNSYPDEVEFLVDRFIVDLNSGVYDSSLNLDVARDGPVSDLDGDVFENRSALCILPTETIEQIEDGISLLNSIMPKGVTFEDIITEDTILNVLWYDGFIPAQKRNNESKSLRLKALQCDENLNMPNYVR
ncbi:PcfJ domain-containing protein [Photobacterium leiognathi]|uniref:hypothetical protein n=1 Tax=Photobacterium leiognathi TaxID=553611 RepID=UPI002982333C|nr:hypothetical protein [Photobacterium leiognathi]